MILQKEFLNQKNKKMVEFVEIDGKETPVWNGVAMTPEKTEKLIGVKKEFPVFGKLVVADGENYYTDLDLYQLLSYFGILFSQDGDGNATLTDCKNVGEITFDELFERSLLVGNQWLIGMRIKPFSELYEKYPKLNINAYMDYFDELNEARTKAINKIVNS